MTSAATPPAAGTAAFLVVAASGWRRRSAPGPAPAAGSGNRSGSGAGTGRSAPHARGGWLPLLLALAALQSPPAGAQAGAPDTPVAPVPPTKVLLPRGIAPEVQALRTASLASHCAACHGSAGRAVADPAVPGLAGLPSAYLADQMRAFKSGSRPATVMHQIAKGYTDPQIEQLAAYFAAQPK